jgi:hypothetical protein
VFSWPFDGELRSRRSDRPRYVGRRGRQQAARAEARVPRPVESLSEPQLSDPLRRRPERRRAGKRVERADKSEEDVERRIVPPMTNSDSGEPLELRFHYPAHALRITSS